MNQSVNYKLKMTAFSLCDELFKGKVDKAGVEYHYHLCFVSDEAAELMPEPALLAETRITGMLHDVLEDCSDQITEEQLKEIFGNRIVENVKILTMPKNGSMLYREYIDRICNEYGKGNIVPLYVKLADLTHNMDVRRLPTEMMQKDLIRLKKYHDSYLILNETLNLRRRKKSFQQKIDKFYELEQEPTDYKFMA